MGDAVEVAERSLCLGEDVEGAKMRGPLPLGDVQVGAKRPVDGDFPFSKGSCPEI